MKSFKFLMLIAKFEYKNEKNETFIVFYSKLSNIVNSSFNLGE